MDDQDGTFGPATLSTPIIPVLDLHAESIFLSRSNSAPVNTIVGISNSQVTVSAGAAVVFEVFASFVFDNVDGVLGGESYALFDFDSGFQISNPNMTVTSAPWILF
jgi:hypothetical protein